MKTSNVIFVIISLLLFICLIPACKNSGEQKINASHKSDTVYVPRIDTIMIFNPDSNVEYQRIMKSVDTIVQGSKIIR